MRKSIYITTAVLLLLAVVGCDTTTGPGTGQSQDGLAVVSLAIAGTGGRTVLPAQAKLTDAAAWRLLGGKIGETRKPLTALFSYPTNQTLHLATGDWDFTLEGYADESGETLILGETIRGRRITLEGPNTLSFVVEPIAEGTGSIEIAIELPAGHGITRVEVFKDGKDLKSPITPDGNNVVFKQEGHEAGDYYYSFRLYNKDEDLYGVVSELVQVRMNLSSTAAYKLGEEDLNLSYVIEYHLDVNEPDPDYYRRTDAALVLAELDDRKGYEFDGWHDNDGLGGAPVAKLPTPGEGGDRDFYARWEKITYNISYELDDKGTNHAANPLTYTIESSEIILQDPTPNGSFIFLHWYVEGSPESAVAKIPAGSTGHKTFYAKWIAQHTVAFDPNGGISVEGSVALEPQSVLEGGYAVEPPGMTKALDLNDLPEAPYLYTGLTFAGWHNDPDCEDKLWDFEDPVTEPLELYAKWTAVPVDISQQTGNNTIEKALNYIKAYPPGVSTKYTIVVEGNTSMPGASSANINNANAVITLVGKGPSPTEITLTGKDSLFYITAGKLVLDNNITLIGNSLAKNDSIGAVIRIDGASAFLTMKDGATIRGNTGINGGGVNLASGSTFNMEGGKISGNTAADGGGIRVQYSTVIMKKGEISNNISTTTDGTTGGGGVYLSFSSSFTMEGGTISGNTAANYGGGVWVGGSSFTKIGGFIGGDNDTTPYPGNGNSTDNTAKSAASSRGHAVFYSTGGNAYYYRNAALENNDGGNIDTGAEKPASSGAGEKNNWTMR